MPNKNLRIGRGKNMSLAKAGLKYFYEEYLPDLIKFGYEEEDGFLTYGDLDAMHRIVTIAGAEHRSFLTPVQVSGCLSNSPYWEHECIHGFYKGIGNGKANCYKPSEKGRKYYYERIKKDKK